MRSRRWMLALAIAAGILIAHISCSDEEPSGVGDCVPPVAVHDLRVLSVRDSSVLIGWTAPGDDGADGAAAKYDVRFSTSPDTADAWWDALTVAIESPPRPKRACGAESLWVNGMSPDSVYFFALRTADEVPNWSQLSNVASSAGLAPPDTIPPARVMDLATVSATDISITLAWTAPGDNGNLGRAAQYDLRYASDPIGDGDWDVASRVGNLPRPGVGGALETCTVLGLQPLNVYHFALKTTDEASNWSALSNGASAATPAPVGATHTVQADGTGDFITIQAAAWAAAPGDTIELGDGTYSGEGNRDVYCRSLTVRSASGDPVRCIVDCGGSDGDPHYGFLFDSWGKVESALEGITVTKGWGERGGAVHAFAADGPTVTLRNCNFVNNQARNYGAAVFVAGKAVLENCSFLGNSSGFVGGGLCGDLDSRMLVEDCFFSDNSASRGGGVSCGGKAEFTRCTFTRNRKSGLYADRGSDVMLVDCVFSENSAPDGAGIYADRAGAVLTNCTFSGNSATYLGGGISCSGSTLVASGCVFSGNSAMYPVSGGSGVCCSGGSCQFSHCTFVGNTGRYSAVIVGGAGLAFDHTIVAYNPGSVSVYCLASTSAPVFTCCDLFRNEAPDWVGCIADQASKNGNFSLDPLFCNRPAGDFSLWIESPCVPGEGCGLVGALGVGCQ